jgi:hypothetical protein
VLEDFDAIVSLTLAMLAVAAAFERMKPWLATYPGLRPA